MRKIIILLTSLLSFTTIFGQTIGQYTEYTASAVTTTIKLVQYNNYLIIKGTPTLSATDYVFTNDATTPHKGMIVRIYYNATVTYTGAGRVKIFGLTLNQTQANHKGIIECIYDGSAWVVDYIPSLIANTIDSTALATNVRGDGIKLSGSLMVNTDSTTSALGFVGTSPTKKLRVKFDNTTIDLNASKQLEVATHGIDSTKILYGAVRTANLPNMTRGTVRVGDASNRPSDLNAKTINSLMIGSGTDVVSGAVRLGAIQPNYKPITSDIWWSFTNDSIMPKYLNDTLRREIMLVPVSFDTLKTNDTFFVFCPYNAKILRINYSVTGSMLWYAGCLTIKPTIDIFVQPNTSTGIGSACYSLAPTPTNIGVQPTTTTVSVNNIVGKGTYIRVLAKRAAGCERGGALLTITLQRIY